MILTPGWQVVVVFAVMAVVSIIVWCVRYAATLDDEDVTNYSMYKPNERRE